MARFSSIICACIVSLAAFAAAQAPTARHHTMNGQAPINSQLPNASQQMQPNGGPPPQQGVPRPLNQPPQTAPVPNGQQPPNAQRPNPQQPMAQQADPPPTAPPSQPVVTYHDGLLTVQALNSTLGSVVAAIKSKTGIEFEGWENVPDRVALSLGPAPAGEVLSAIFSGSKFDFIAIGRPDSPAIVQRVILSPRKGTGTTAAAQQPPQQRAGQEGDDDDTPDETVNAGDPQDTPAQPPPQAQAQPEPQQQPKTPDQLLQELQEMQKQQQQQQQGVNPNPNQVPRKQPPL